jgi:hypothetical protein
MCAFINVHNVYNDLKCRSWRSSSQLVPQPPSAPGLSSPHCDQPWPVQCSSLLGVSNAGITNMPHHYAGIGTWVGVSVSVHRILTKITGTVTLNTLICSTCFQHRSQWAQDGPDKPSIAIRIPERAKFSLSPRTTRPAVRWTQLTGGNFATGKAKGINLTTHLHLVMRLGMSGALPQLSYLSSWPAGNVETKIQTKQRFNSAFRS